MIKMFIHERIRQYIKDNGMLLNFVADKSGIDKKKFYRLVNGKTEMNLDEYERICSGLGVDPAYFFKEKFSKNEKFKSA